jgi:hypothetical protein
MDNADELDELGLFLIYTYNLWSFVVIINIVNV